MDILIFIAIFYALPQIFKKINENNKNKSGFNFEDIDTIKRELTKLKTSTEAKVKDVKPKTKASNAKLEKDEVVQKKSINSSETIPNQISEFHKKEAAVYNLDTNHVKQSNKDDIKTDDKIKLGLNDKKELRRAIIMSEVLGKPRALKKIL